MLKSGDSIGTLKAAYIFNFSQSRYVVLNVYPGYYYSEHIIYCSYNIIVIGLFFSLLKRSRSLGVHEAD